MKEKPQFEHIDTTPSQPVKKVISESLTDAELINYFKSPAYSNNAFNAIVVKYQQKIYFHIRRIVIDHDDANDVVQNSFVKAWKGLNNFREDSQLYTWLYRIATNEALTFLKKKKRRLFIPIDSLENQLADKLSNDPLFDANKLELKIQKAILSLPEKQRIVFNMRYYDEIKYEDMSEILDTSVGALKASYHHAMIKVQKYITGD